MSRWGETYPDLYLGIPYLAPSWVTHTRANHYFWHGDFVKWGFCYMCEVFVLLTSCASLDVVVDPDSLQGPEVIVLDFPYCFIMAWVSCPPVVMILPQDSSFKGVIWTDNQSSFLVPPCHSPWFFIPFDRECLFPLFHSRLMSFLCFLYFVFHCSQITCFEDV